MKSMQVPPARRPLPSPSGGKRSPLFWWEWWSRHTTPPPPPPGAPLPAIQNIQRGKMSSFLLLVIVCLSLVGFFIALISSDRAFAILTAGSVLLCIALLVLNRRGKVLLVGISLWTVITIALDFELFHLATLSPGAIPLFDLLVSSELLAALILPLPFVVIAACWNSVFALSALALLPHTPFLEAVIAANAAQLSLWSVALYCLVAGGLWILVRAGERMHNAEEVVRLQQALQREQGARGHLEEALQQMEETATRVLSGDLSARIRLTAECPPPLGSLAVAFDQMLSRMQRLSQVQASHKALLPLLAQQQSLEGMQTALHQDIAQAIQALHLAEAQQQPIQLGTPRVEAMRPLFRALHQRYIMNLTP